MSLVMKEASNYIIKVFSISVDQQRSVNWYMLGLYFIICGTMRNVWTEFAQMEGWIIRKLIHQRFHVVEQSCLVVVRVIHSCTPVLSLSLPSSFYNTVLKYFVLPFN